VRWGSPRFQQKVYFKSFVWQVSKTKTVRGRCTMASLKWVILNFSTEFRRRVYEKRLAKNLKKKRPLKGYNICRRQLEMYKTGHLSDFCKRKIILLKIIFCFN